MVKLVFLIFMLWVGWHYGGWWGVYSMFLISAVCLAPFAHQHQQPQEKQISKSDWNPDEVVTGARKGHPDPTRPGPEDYAAMVTDNYGKRRA